MRRTWKTIICGLPLGDSGKVPISILEAAIRSQTMYLLFFYERGWQGLLVEPQRNLVDLHTRLRPRDISVCALIGARSGLTDFHVFRTAKNKRCYANTLRPRSRMLLKVMKGG